MYTYFDKTKEVMCVIQIVDDNDVVDQKVESVMRHKSDVEGTLTTHTSTLYDKDGTTYGYSDSYVGTAQASLEKKYENTDYNS